MHGEQDERPHDERPHDERPQAEAVADRIQSRLLLQAHADLAEAAITEGLPPGELPAHNLLPEAPWCPPLNPSGVLAASIVGDFDQPEDAKILVCFRLLAAADAADRPGLDNAPDS